MTNYVPCPQCKNANAERLKFTWWGGVLGPKLLTHVKCQTCGKKYNGKTGGDNIANIVIYSVVVFGICFVIFFVLVIGLILLNMR